MAVLRTRLLVLLGGLSNEHRAPRVSAGSVLAHLDPERFEVTEGGPVAPLPGSISTSLYPRMRATTGVDDPTVLSTLVATAGSASGPGSPE